MSEKQTNDCEVDATCSEETQPQEQASWNAKRNPYDERPVVVSVGASAGGLDELMRMLSSLPDDPPMAFVVIQHLDPTHDSALTAIPPTERDAEPSLPLNTSRGSGRNAESTGGKLATLVQRQLIREADMVVWIVNVDDRVTYLQGPVDLYLQSGVGEQGGHGWIPSGERAATTWLRDSNHCLDRQRDERRPRPLFGHRLHEIHDQTAG
ncbi:chemotaxis-specific methylesterase [Rubripirellula reticaptiva]|uniref:Chemotaxis-specific methylesterase n=1 Tax=Rubripirellula reticaptiva TaxID=2528013 RepID=A0A5C6EL08_9BACT|nr:chemotaxis-specific methylesterase [Rubripirellula reticaptiva]